MSSKKLFGLVLLLAAVSLACNFARALVSPQPEPTPQAAQATVTPLQAAPLISGLVFCKEVTEQGEAVYPTTQFPPGTAVVWALFTYKNMQDGMSWQRIWERNGEVYVDSQVKTWQGGPSGWQAYSLTDDAALSGEFKLTILVEGQVVQQGTFTVPAVQKTPESSASAFGAIQFAEDVTQDNLPVRQGTRFEAGITEVYAVFPYINMTKGQSWSREWTHNGKALVKKDLAWEKGHSGVFHVSYSDENGLEAGQYTLNLFIDGQLARSASFEIYDPNAQLEITPDAYPVPDTPAAPEEVIDADLLPAWQMLADSQQETLRELANFVLEYHIRVKLEDNFESSTTYARYSYSCDDPPIPGEVIYNRDKWAEQSWEEVAGVLAHELTHAVQHMADNICGCTQNKEYYAAVAEIYVYNEFGGVDLVTDNYPDVFGEDGYFSGDLLWTHIQEVYAECPEY